MRYSKRMNRPEQALQKSFVDFLTLSQPTNCVWFAVPNGGQRSPIEAAILKGQGVKAGVADFMFAFPNKTAFLEFKADNGVLSPSQLDFRNDCIRLRIPYKVVRTLEEAVGFCKFVGMEFRLEAKIQGDT